MAMNIEGNKTLDCLTKLSQWMQLLAKGEDKHTCEYMDHNYGQTHPKPKVQVVKMLEKVALELGFDLFKECFNITMDNNLERMELHAKGVLHVHNLPDHRIDFLGVCWGDDLDGHLDFCLGAARYFEGVRENLRHMQYECLEYPLFKSTQLVKDISMLTGDDLVEIEQRLNEDKITGAFDYLVNYHPQLRVERCNPEFQKLEYGFVYLVKVVDMRDDEPNLQNLLIQTHSEDNLFCVYDNQPDSDWEDYITLSGLTSFIPVLRVNTLLVHAKLKNQTSANG